MSVSLPVLVTTYNRPGHTRDLMDALRAVTPQRLFISSDGPKEDKESSRLVSEVRAIIAHAVDWPCEVETLFQAHNLGSRRGMQAALNWFFAEVEEGVVLEDDCIPHPEFFELAGIFLDKYRDRREVWGFSGDNSGSLRVRGRHSVGFGSFPLVWGWATWADRWEKYDAELRTYPYGDANPFGVGKPANLAFAQDLNRIYAGEGKDAWDYQLSWTVLSQQGLWGYARDNLITNIGFGPSATHTTQASRRANVSSDGLGGPITLPKKPRRSRWLDIQVLFKIYRLHWLALGRVKQLFFHEGRAPRYFRK
jgi:hypothetical protein